MKRAAARACHRSDHAGASILKRSSSPHSPDPTVYGSSIRARREACPSEQTNQWREGLWIELDAYRRTKEVSASNGSRPAKKVTLWSLTSIRMSAPGRCDQDIRLGFHYQAPVPIILPGGILCGLITGYLAGRRRFRRITGGNFRLVRTNSPSFPKAARPNRI